MPLTDKGFQRKTYDDILTEQTNRARLLFGDDIDTSENSTFGKILRLYCLDANDNQELAESVYLSAFPTTAAGVSLDRVCRLAGITRNSETYAQHTVTINGNAGTQVGMGFLVSSGDVVFHTVNGYVIGSDGKVTATVECNEAGTIGNVPTSSIDTIVNPLPDVESVSNSAIAEYGKNSETDYELRTRFYQALNSSGSGTLDTIKGAIQRVPTVSSVYIEENTTNQTVGVIPPHGFICYVLAPASAKQEIAEAIFSKKPIGIPTGGETYADVLDISGTAHRIYFSWTKEVEISVKCTITVNSEYSSESLQTIKDNIVNKLSVYQNAQNVTATSLYGEIYETGVTDVTSLEISKNGSTYTTGSITITNTEVARTAADKIEVTVIE